MNQQKKSLLQSPIQHIDIKSFDSTKIIDSFSDMAFQSRNLARASKIFESMIKDEDCSIILCLAGSLVSAGLKHAIADLLKYNMVDCVVSTAANIVDQDFFEGLGFSHYKGSPTADDNKLQELMVDRIYDTFIDEEELRFCDNTIKQIADGMPSGVYSSREFIVQMGRFLKKNHPEIFGITLEAFNNDIPIFCPAFSDSSAGFGLVEHQYKSPMSHVAIDSVKDFRELTMLKTKAKETGLVMIGGGVPKNFIQDTVVAADILGIDSPMHKYAIQLTVADERDGALSGSTLKEANSWGKVDVGSEQMVFGEATLSFPLLASYVYHMGSWKKRSKQKLNSLL